MPSESESESEVEDSDFNAGEEKTKQKKPKASKGNGSSRPKFSNGNHVCLQAGRTGPNGIGPDKCIKGRPLVMAQHMVVIHETWTKKLMIIQNIFR